VKAVKTSVAIVGVIVVIIGATAINEAYCAWAPDTIVGKVIKWTQWDPRRC
jgi:hypothetical protein